MLPTPDTRPWSSSCRLIPDVRRRTRRTNSSSSNSGSRGSRAMWAISVGSSAPPAETDRPPNMRWSTNRSSLPRAGEGRAPSKGLLSSAPSSERRTRRWRSLGASGGCTSSCPLMPRWPSSASPLSSGSQRYLPRRRAALIRRPSSAAAKPAGPRRSRRTGRGWSTSTRVIVAPTTWRSSPARTTSTSGSSGTVSAGSVGHDGAARGARGGVLDAEVGGDLAVRRLGGGLLGLLLRPAHAVAVEGVADPDLGGEGLHVVGAVVLDDVLGDAEAVLGRQLLQRGLPVQARPHRRGGDDERVEEPVHDVRGDGEPAAEVDRTEDGLDGVGEDRGLVAAPGRLLAAAELDVLADAAAATDLRQGAGVDDRSTKLGQPALGEVGVGPVERLRHDDAEHRVAQELQALVGRQAAVLVGERPVGEGSLEQLGIQLRVPERCSQLAVVGQWTGCAQRT